jgi:hypothetical protein
MIEVLERAAAADAEVPAARCHALGRGVQHFDGDRLVVAALAANAPEAHGLAGQRAVDEHRFAGDVRDAAALVVQRLDPRRLDRSGRPQAPAQAVPYWRQ